MNRLVKLFVFAAAVVAGSMFAAPKAEAGWGYGYGYHYGYRPVYRYHYVAPVYVAPVYNYGFCY